MKDNIYAGNASEDYKKAYEDLENIFFYENV